MKNGKYGKDHPENFIEGALTGGSGKSNGMHEKSAGRKEQTIVTPVAMDNVQLAMKTESSICDEGGFGGGPGNLKHSFAGNEAQNDVGAAGKVKHVIIPWH